MTSLLTLFALGVIVLVANHGRIARLDGVGLRGSIWIIVLFALQSLARGRLVDPLAVRPHWSPIVPWAVVSLALIAVVILNLRTPGVWLLLGGLTLNLLVVVLNGGMPFSAVAAGAAGAASRAGGFYVPIDGATKAAFLGDVLRVPTAGPGGIMVSPGDLLLLLGVWVVVVRASLVAEAHHQETPTVTMR